MIFDVKDWVSLRFEINNQLLDCNFARRASISIENKTQPTDCPLGH